MAPTHENIRTFGTQEMAEGSGARVKRAFPSPTRDHLDPFVLLDEFYVEGGGFPEHPHEGFEIVTYMLEGAFEHADSTGAEETVHAGGAQRITAGSGLKHSELPGTDGPNRGLQLWINLPREDKETAPDYEDAEAGELHVEDVGTATVKTVVGDGSPLDLHTPVEYLVVSLPAAATFQWEVDEDWNGFCYVTDGRVSVAGDVLDAGEFAVKEGGGTLSATLTAAEDATVALVSGRPHHEPIRQRGPVVL